MLVLAPGVLAVGVGQRTSPAGAEAFAQRLFAAGAAHAVLAVPIAQDRATMHLDTVCTMVDRDAVVMYPPLADTLEAYVRRAEDGDVRGGPEPFLRRRRRARWRSTRCGSSTPASTPSPPSASSGTTATTRSPSRPGSCVAYERNTETNARLEAEGIEVAARSPAPSSAPAAAGRAACPAR